MEGGPVTGLRNVISTLNSFFLDTEGLGTAGRVGSKGSEGVDDVALLPRHAATGSIGTVPRSARACHHCRMSRPE